MSLKIVNTKNAEKLNLTFNAFKFLNGSSFSIIKIELSAGELIEPHDHGTDVAFYVISGEGELRVDETAYLLSKGDSVIINPGKIRSWQNDGDDILELLVIKAND